jgi:hypothetical protein
MAFLGSQPDRAVAAASCVLRRPSASQEGPAHGCLCGRVSSWKRYRGQGKLVVACSLCSELSLLTSFEALPLIAALVNDPGYPPLLAALQPYLTSGSPTQEQAACTLLELATGPLAAWLPQLLLRTPVVFDVVLELLPQLLQSHPAASAKLASPAASASAASTAVITDRASAAVLYLQLLLAGWFDDRLSAFLDCKLQLLFLLALLQPRFTSCLQRGAADLSPERAALTQVCPPVLLLGTHRCLQTASAGCPAASGCSSCPGSKVH